MDKKWNIPILLLGLFAVGGSLIYIYNTTRPQAPGAATGTPCTMVGQKTTINNQNYVCGINNVWQVDTTATTIPGQPTTTSLPGMPQLECASDMKVSYSIITEDSLDEEAAPQTLLENTVYIISSAGQQLEMKNTSTSGSTEFKIPCSKDSVQFITKGSDIYTTDEVVIGGKTYKGATAPTYRMSNGVPTGFVLESALVQTKLHGDISVTVWNDDPNKVAATTNITLAASGTTSDYIHFRIKTTEDDKAAQGIICAVNYTLTHIRAGGVEVEGYTGGASARQEDARTPIQYSDAEDAFILMYNNAPLTLDLDTRTADKSEIEYVVRLQASTTNPAFNMTICCADSGPYLEASGANVRFVGGGVWYPHDASGNNLFIPGASEGCDHFEVI